jgi:hypothetical protein
MSVDVNHPRKLTIEVKEALGTPRQSVKLGTTGFAGKIASARVITRNFWRWAFAPTQTMRSPFTAIASARG